MSFDALGWAVFAPEPSVQNWIAHAKPAAIESVSDPKRHIDGLRCGGTWFVGVDALPNDADGRIGKGPTLKGAAMENAAARYGVLPLHKAQVSVIYPGYPQPMAGETPAAFRYRRDRDAAHVDGLLPEGPQRRRFLREPHAYVVGIPLTDSIAAPLVVWDGSHHVMRAAFETAFAGVDPSDWQATDVTDIYQSARRQCFESCTRREITVPMGGAYIIHRLALHGVAPWKDGDTAPPEGRMVAYFRPHFPDVKSWLSNAPRVRHDAP